jgi:hypothetical protein
MFPYLIDKVVRRQQSELMAKAARNRQLSLVPIPVPQWRLWLGTELIHLGMRIKASASVAPSYRNIRTPNPGC